MAASIVVTSLSRHFAPRLGGEAARAAAGAFMGALGARTGRPVFWDEREDAPRFEEVLGDARALADLVRAAVALDGGPARANAPAAGGAGDAAVEAARLHLRRTRFPHLVRGGPIYLPVGFDRPVELRRTPLGATVLGSASRLLAEVEQVADETRPALPGALEPVRRLAGEALRLRLPLILVAGG